MVAQTKMKARDDSISAEDWANSKAMVSCGRTYGDGSHCVDGDGDVLVG